MFKLVGVAGFGVILFVYVLVPSCGLLLGWIVERVDRWVAEYTKVDWPLWLRALLFALFTPFAVILLAAISMALVLDIILSSSILEGMGDILTTLLNTLDFFTEVDIYIGWLVLTSWAFANFALAQSTHHGA